MNRIFVLAAALSLVVIVAIGIDASRAAKNPDTAAAKPESAVAGYFVNDDQITRGSVNVGGRGIDYRAIAGTIIVHPKGWDDVSQTGDDASGGPSPTAAGQDKGAKNSNDAPARASMFYVYYSKTGTSPEQRPVTFLFNGGPGSSTVWLHMGAFGPKRVVTADDSHTSAAPYSLINNNYSLLDASDLVFIDAPGTGFSRITGKDREKAFFGVDEDAHAFAEFITAFLSKYGRWNSPKYLFGESYGTTRAANLINLLETERSVDFNGVIMLSQILAFDLSGDSPQYNPGVDLPYQIMLPTFAATAWYHKKVPGNPGDLRSFVLKAEHYAMNDYAQALKAGAGLSAKQRMATAVKLHQFTGLPVSYILKADLRINVGEFEKNLQDQNDVTTGRLDTRFSGPTMDPLSKEADYDPQSASISSAYVSGFNDYVRRYLNYGQGKTFKPEIEIWRTWNFLHQPPGVPIPIPQAANVMPDIAMAMKYNPKLKVMVNGGYYDLATPYYEGWFEMHHLQIPNSMQPNIEYRYYESGHMVYAHEQSLQQLHDNVADFIRRTDNIE